MSTVHEPFLIAEVALTATDESIQTLVRMLDRAHRAGRHAHFICSVTGFDPGVRDPWTLPAFVALCGRLVDSGFVSFLDFSTLHPPGQPEHLQTGFGALEIWRVSQGLFGDDAPTPAVLDQARAALARAGQAAAAALRSTPPSSPV